MTGQAWILFFYPAANTLGCTKEACDFRDNEASLAALGYRLLGISADSVETNARFHENQNLGYPLLSDTDLAVHRMFGIDHTTHPISFISGGRNRSTFVIDSDFRIQEALYNVRAMSHVRELKELLIRYAERLP